MSPGHRFVTFTLLLLFIACFFLLPLGADGEGNAAGPLAANNSAELQQAAQPGQSANQQSPANDAEPPFPVVEHGKWGYMDKTGKIVISPTYYDAHPFIEGLAPFSRSPSSAGRPYGSNLLARPAM